MVGTALALVFIGAACSDSSNTTGTPTAEPTVIASSSPKVLRGAAPTPTVIIDGLNGPTQFVDGPAGSLLIAQINGDENAMLGQILIVDPASKKRSVLFRGLDKPTGVAWTGGHVWIMERRRLVRAAWEGPGTEPGSLETMVDDLPFNGRSEGTLTVTPDQRLLYETTGSIEGGKVVDGSGVLWVFDPETKRSSKIAVGLKNAYAHAFFPDGQLATVEIGDNIDAAPVDELNVVPYGQTGPVQFGWPECPGDTTCSKVISPLTTFEPHATPSGVAIDAKYAYVTLFVSGEVRKVSLTGKQTNAKQSTIASDLKGPHTIALRPDGALWVSEHLANRIVAITPE